MQEVNTSYIILTLIGAITSVTGALVALFKIYHKGIDNTELKQEHYEKLHLATLSEIAVLKGEIGYLKGQQDGIQTLARQVLEVVAKSRRHDEHD